MYDIIIFPILIREDINIFLNKNILTENFRFRKESLIFRITEADENYIIDKIRAFDYLIMEKNS
jgi:ATP-binding cassette subfamily E protein 1